MEVIKLFVPHSDIGDNSSLEEAYNALDSVVKDINNNEISEWPPLARNLTIGKPEDFQINQINPIRQTANKLEEAAEKAHGIFIFVEGDISERIKEWYQEQSKLLSGLDDEECVFIRIFWDIREQKSNECFHKFKEGETLNKDSNYIKTYKSIPELKDELKKSLKKLVLTWSSMISQGIEIPTLKSIKAKKKNKLVRSILFSVICGIILLFVLFCRNYHKEQSQEQPQEPSAIMVDTTRALLNDGITNADAIVESNPDTPEYETTSPKNSDSKSAPALKPESKPEPNPNPEPPTAPFISPNTFVVDAKPSFFQAEISEEIGKLSSFLLPCEEGEIQRWTFVIIEDPNITEAPKKVDNDPSVVTVDFTIEIKDAKGELRIPQKHIPQFGKGKKVEDAIRAARLNAAHKIASFISDTIKQ